MHRLLSKESFRRYSSIGEQIAMSIANLSTSVFVIKLGGVANFGLYSFLFAFSLLATGVCAALIHRQMVLHISPLSSDERRDHFKSTFIHEGCFLIAAVIVFAIPLFLYSDEIPGEGIKLSTNDIFAFLVYIVIFNTYELFRQYLYSQDAQTTSFRYTVVFLVSLLTIQAFIVFSGGIFDDSVMVGYSALAGALGISLALNSHCRNDLLSGVWPDIYVTASRFKNYLNQGKFGSTGSMVTWLQNQSMGPLLMLIAGPVLVGYYNIGRLMVMPIMVINQGLVNSTTPFLRRIFTRDGTTSLKKQLNKLGFLNLSITALYAASLALLDFSGFFERFIEHYSDIRIYLFFWIILFGTTMVRFWIGQFFVITLNLRRLLTISVTATIFSMSGVVMTGLVFNNISAALLFIVLGEILTIGLLLLFMQKENSDTLNSPK